jgi:hypothetical protein
MATVAVVPASYLLYLSANSDDSTEEPWFTRVLHKLDYWQDEFRDRNDLHTKLADQAASDRVLFLNSGTPPEKRLVDVRNNEYVSFYLLPQSFP